TSFTFSCVGLFSGNLTFVFLNPVFLGCAVTVADNGPGVQIDNLDRIFEPFFVEHPSSDADGHGLGLPITRRIAETLGGTATASNNPGGGLVVSLAVPRVSRDEEVGGKPARLAEPA
ncbi:MAG: sensor histidine kinase, partial [Pseudomonadota bacterium]